ncbi:MAG: TrbG/VirB9 family P-type conjugative transfer protein [Acidobacteria bacterium]|nr:TrbG/VirB9 family P-type conjugative transfer protein [Acidobacteriota bacterium]
MRGSGTRILPAALSVALLWAAATLSGATARAVEVTDDTVVEVAAKVRYTTVIVVPEDERILTFVCGDSEYWGLEGKANVALLKPMKEGIRTNVALITDMGSIYSLTAAEGGKPDLKVYLHRPAPEADGAARIGTPLEAPTFVAASELADYERQAELARDQARAAQRAAQTLLEEGVEDFRSRYPGTLRFDYRLPAEAAGDPWRVRAMWHDQRFTYLLSDAPEAPALYEERDGQPAMVAFDYEDGLYVARHVVGAGWLQIGKRRLKWRYDPPRELP